MWRYIRQINAQERIGQLEAEVAELKAIIVGLRAKIETLESGGSKPPTFVKPNTHKQKREHPKKTRRQRAAEQNAARKKEPAAQVTEIRQHALERCPECDYKLSGQSIARRRQVIDLPPMPALQVVEHQVIKRWCPACKVWHMPKLDLSGEVLRQGRMGHGIASLVSWLRTTLRLPVKSVQTLETLETLVWQIYKLKLSAGEIVELSHAVAKAGQTVVAEIKQAIVASPQVHMDETGWREDGDNGYVWAASTPDGLRAFMFHFSRAGAIPEAFLEGFTGTLVNVTCYFGRHSSDATLRVTRIRRMGRMGRIKRIRITTIRQIRLIRSIRVTGLPGKAARSSQLASHVSYRLLRWLQQHRWQTSALLGASSAGCAQTQR